MLKQLIKGFLYFSISILLILSALFLFFQTEWAQTYVSQKIIRTLSKHSDAKIKIGKISGFIPFQLIVHDIAIDYQEEQFSAKNASVLLSPITLFSEKTLVGSLELYDVNSSIDPRAHNLTIQTEFNLDIITKTGSLELQVGQISLPGSYVAIQANINDKVHTHFVLKDVFGQMLQLWNQSAPPADYYLSLNATNTLSDWKKLLQGDFKSFRMEGNMQMSMILEEMHSSVSSKVSLNTDQELVFSHVLGEVAFPEEFQPDLITFSGAFFLNLTSNNIKGTLSLSPFQLAPLSNLAQCPLKGEVSLNCNLKGALKDFSAELTLLANSIEIDTLRFDDLLTTSTLSFSQEKAKGNMHLTAAWNDHPLELTTQIRWDGKSAKFSQIVVDTQWTQFKGNLTLDIRTLLFQGTFNGSIGPLEPIFNIVQIPQLFSADSTSFTAQFNPDETNRTEQFKFTLNINGLTSRNFSLNHVTLEGHLDDLLNDFEGIIKLEAKGLKKSNLTADVLTFSTFVAKSYAMHSFEGSMSNQSDQDWIVYTSGSWRSFPDSAVIAFNQLSGHVGEFPILLKKPFDIQIDNQHFSLSPVHLLVNKSRLEAHASISDDLLKGLFKVSNMPLSMLELFYEFPFTAEGNLMAEFKAAGSLDFPVINGELAVEKLEIDHPKAPHLKNLTFNLETAYRDSELNLSGKLAGITELPIEVHAALPVHLSLQPADYVLNRDKKLVLNFAGEGEISAIPELLVFESSSVSGYTKVNVGITGTIEDPLVNGTVTLQNGSWESLDTGAVIKNIQAEFKANGKELVTTYFTASDGNQGTLQAKGSVLLDADKAFPYNWSFDMKNVRLVRFDNINASVSGPLYINGNMEKGEVTGDLVLDEARFLVLEDNPGLITTIEVNYQNGTPSFKPEAEEDQQDWALDLNVHLNIPRHAYVQGKDLSSEWKGDLQFTGNSYAPIFNGTLNMMRGEYLFNGRPIESNQGIVNFSGESGKKSTVYIVAELDLDEIKVEMILKGAINDPVLSFRSNPPMSQREILSWLLFNHGTGELTPFQGAELNQTAFSLNSAKNSSKNTDMLSKLRTSFGIDRIDISSGDTDDTNEVSLRVGKYISKGIFVSLSKSINAEANQVGIEAKLIKDFKIKAEIGDNSSAKVNLKWEKDY